ncbi:IclR family transcriptional regulator C-terminal domain-containing protein [Halostagnicola sp. A56]|uniref:IclR family transcriptional regulator domain-containing protein n=1 Tax=Halostagnicola sp. A56 TaxID=1495067 RepID=UPI0009E56EB0|nr:IclR family transcriptional regulator C-terminal domain-containing protein [Halostagnicola sp. A56]
MGFTLSLTKERPTSPAISIQKPGPLSVGTIIKIDDQVDELINQTDLTRVTAETITTRDELESGLKEIRAQGIAFNDKESHERIRAVGSPIILDGKVHGAVSVAGPAKRLTDEYFASEIPNLLLGAVNEIELKLDYGES